MAFAAVSRYGRPPLEVYHGGGVFVTKSVSADSPDGKALLKANRQLLKDFGMVRGATHAEFIKGEDGQFYFLEVAARVGGANIDLLVEAATGVNLWKEWARVELADISGSAYSVKPDRRNAAGLLVCLAREAKPDLGGYEDPEVVWRMDKKQHAGLLLSSESQDRIDALLDAYTRRFGEDFLAVAPPLESESQMQDLE